MANLKISDAYFGELLPLIENEDITDINWNGKELWIDDLNKGRYLSDIQLDDRFVTSFSTRIANLANKPLNKFNPLLEAETDLLRVSIISSEVTNTGTSISIRKTPPTRRIHRETMYENGYCTELLDLFMQAAVKSGCSIIVGGTPGVGKTEYIKYLTQYIPANERSITIEDNLELRYREINPGYDCIELQVHEQFTYTDAIKAALRQLPKRILLSEARSLEVIHLLESASTGTGCMTSIHTDDVKKIPDRILNMMHDLTREKENDIYNFFDIGVLIDKDISNGKISRAITQVCVFDRDEGKNSITMIFDNQEFTDNKIPKNLENRLKRHHIQNPLESKIR